MRRIVLALLAVIALATRPLSSVAQSSSVAEQEQIQPILPPGISDFDLELYGKLAYTWTDESSARVIEIDGNFSARMGDYKLRSKDAVLWFTTRTWENRTYLDTQIFLWQDAELVQPAGTTESGPVLLVTLRTFGKLVLNADAHAAVSNENGSLFLEASRARALLKIAPPEEAPKAATPIQVAPTAEQLMLSQPKPPKQVQFSADQLYYEQYEGQSVVVAIDEVMVSQGSPSISGEFMELRADAAVLYMNKNQVSGTLPGLMGDGDRKKKRTRSTTAPADEEGAPRLRDKADDDSESKALQEWVSGVYLEGDVVLTRGERMIRAPRLYYDFQEDRALILDVVTRAADSTRTVPIYVRAEEIRQLSATEYEARKAQFTTSEFHTPHVAIGASKVYLQDRTPRNAAGDIVGVQAGTYKAEHTTLNVEGTPVAYWPFSRGDFSRDRQAFRSAKIGYDQDFGATFETQWHLFNLLGLEQPEGFDATYKQDYFSDRGPGAGIDMDYQQDNYFGLMRSYYIHDDGKDDFGGQRGSITPDHENRGRFTVRHRQFLPKDWELSLETSYISDDQYLESFERAEFENGKDQETLTYLVKRQDNWQFSNLANWRINEFATTSNPMNQGQTEHLPDTMFSLIGEPLGDFATLYSESRAGVVRYRGDNRRYFNGENRRDNTGSTGSVVRGDTREELAFPVPDLGPMKLTPYVMGRVSGYDDGPSGWDEDNTSGGFTRVLGAYGLRGNMMLSKVDGSIESDMLDLHRLRHIIKPDFGVWNAHTNRHPYEMTPFDPGVEDIDGFYGGTMGLRQKFQTQRGGPGKWRTVDWIIFDVEAGFFGNNEKNQVVNNTAWGKNGPVYAYDPPMKTNRSHGDYIFSRPEESISSSFLATNFQYRISDSTVFVQDNLYDFDRGNMGTSNATFAVERDPRLSYFLGWRYIHDTQSNLIAFGGNYKLSEKHTVAIRELYDIDVGRNYSTEFIYVKRWPRWHTAVAFDVDKALDDVGINFSVWPEGSPRLGLGSKRYTGLAESVGMQLR